MIIQPITLRAADAFVTEHHRHNKAAGNGKFAIACVHEGQLVGVGICGRPRSRHLDDGFCFEIYRVCTNGQINATNFIYGRMRRIAQLMGYTKIITYTLQSESGSSLRAVGAVVEASVTHTRQWNSWRTIRRVFQSVTVQAKYRWVL
jgi:hypothetical protein